MFKYRMKLSFPPNVTHGAFVVAEDGYSYRVHYHNKNTPQEFGYIVRHSCGYSHPSGFDYYYKQALSDEYDTGYRQFYSYGYEYPGAPVYFNCYLQFRFVKTISGFPTAGANVTVPLLTAGGDHYITWDNGTQLGNVYPFPSRDYTLDVTFHDIAATCTTPSVVNHKLPMVYMSDIPNVGDVGPAYDFSINISNCPSWMRSVRYKLMAAQPGGGEMVPSNSTLPLLTGSTASGVGVQIRNQNNTLHPFNVWQGIGYNHETGGNYSVPLRARIIRTDANAQPGKVEAAIIFHMEYK